MAKGSGFLKVVGIIMIVFAAIGIIANLIAFLGVGVTATLLGIAPIKLYISLLFGIVASALLLVCGIMGVKDCHDVSKAQSCFTWGIIVAASVFVGDILLPLILGTGVSWLGAILGLILPGLFIYGAILNKQS